MYGPLLAAAGWHTPGPESQYRHRPSQLKNRPCVFGHASRASGMVVRGDDCIIAGSGDALGLVTAETEREARLGADGKIGSRVRQRSNSVESLCEVQRRSLWVDVGS